MTNEQRKAIERLDKIANKNVLYGNKYGMIIENFIEMQNDLKTALSLIKRQKKQIDLMARAIDNYDSQLEINTFKDKEHIKQYFADLVEKE